ncbi:MAG TPA: hypothetical protein VLX85_03155 [Stellaceae bacterium]|nr:hypothetical protein [Stellaceae bacterium]
MLARPHPAYIGQRLVVRQFRGQAYVLGEPGIARGSLEHLGGREADVDRGNLDHVDHRSAIVLELAGGDAEDLGEIVAGGKERLKFGETILDAADEIDRVAAAEEDLFLSQFARGRRGQRLREHPLVLGNLPQQRADLFRARQVARLDLLQHRLLLGQRVEERDRQQDDEDDRECRAGSQIEPDRRSADRRRLRPEP